MQSKERQFIVYIDGGGRDTTTNSELSVRSEESSKDDTGVVLSCLRDRGVDMSTILVCRNCGIFVVDDENNDVAPRKNIPAKKNLWDSWVVHIVTIIPSNDTLRRMTVTQINQGREDSRSALQSLIPSFAKFADDEDRDAVMIDEFYWAGGSSTFVVGRTDEALCRFRSNKKFRESHGTVYERSLKDTQTNFAEDIEWMLKQVVK